jgi:hypothetical protein
MMVVMVYDPLMVAGLVIPLMTTVAPGCGTPAGMSVATVMTVPDTVTVVISLFGQKRVPDDHKRPFPDWYRKTFLD